MQSIPADAGLALLVAPCLVSLAAYGLAWSLAIGWLAVNALRPRHRDEPSGAGGGRRQGLTILKPLCGIDEELEANLASFFALDHRPLQLVFGAASSDDPALALVRRLCRRHPGRDVTIVASADRKSLPWSPIRTMFQANAPSFRSGLALMTSSPSAPSI